MNSIEGMEEKKLVLREFGEVVTPDELRVFCRAVKILKEHSGWGTILIEFKAGETKESRIEMTFRSDTRSPLHPAPA